MGPSSWYRDGLGSVGKTKLISYWKSDSDKAVITVIKIKTMSKAEIIAWIKERIQMHFYELQDTLGNRMEYAVQRTLDDLGILYYANIKFRVNNTDAEIDIYLPQFRILLEIKFWSPKVNKVETFWVTGQFWVFQRLFSEFLKLPVPQRFVKVKNIEEATDFLASLVHDLNASQGLPVSP